MFDFSRITDTISGLVGSLGSEQAGQAANIPELMQNVGLDPSILQGLSQTEIGSLLASYGIDISNISEADLTQYLDGLGMGEGFDLISAPWGDGSSET